MAASTRLLSQDFIERLQRLAWTLARRAPGEGGRAARPTGGRHAFRGHRPYSPGDEPRDVDWNVVARTDQLVVKVFGREEETAVDLLVDATASMGVGDPIKSGAATRLAAALAYLALCSHHRLRIGALRDGDVALCGPFQGLESTPASLRELERLEPASGRDALGGLRGYLSRTRRTGAVALITDAMDGPALHELLVHLGRQAGEATLFHLLAPQDLDPSLTGRLRLTDAEDGSVITLDAGAALLGRYRKAVQTFRHELEERCRRHGVVYHPASSADALESVVLSWHRRRKAG